MMMRHGKYSDVALIFWRRISKLLRRYFFYTLVFFVTFPILLDLVSTLHTSRPTFQPTPSATDSDEYQIYFASLCWHQEDFTRKYLAPAVLDIVRNFGKERVFFSFVASKGLNQDNTDGELENLGFELDRLGVEKSIVLQNKTHAEEITWTPEKGKEGWIDTPQGKKLRRMSYLAELRNKAMKPLGELAARNKGNRIFSKVIWLNDVIFDVKDIENLLNTNGGNFDAACSLDFKNPKYIYDTFALRDSSGVPIASQKWPYFFSALSRSSIQKHFPARVRSCWNGVVAFDAAPFYSTSAIPDLEFRALPDSLAADYHLEASECCLIHVDSPFSSNGVWVNPIVRVAYNPDTYKMVNQGKWPTIGQRVEGILWNYWARWKGWLGRYFERRQVEGRIAKWQSERKYHQVIDKTCIVRETQFLTENGWEHVWES